MHVDVLPPLVGGAVMGAAASLFLWTHGRAAGIAGLYGGALERVSDRTIRLAFIAGLVASGVVVRWLAPATLPGGGNTSLGVVLLAGLLVGFGARLGSGCTSGHGICGVSRLSRRAIAATAVFMIMGVLTACVARHLLGVGS
jgi:uncharacterized membrane protein YedE/YeeE